MSRRSRKHSRSVKEARKVEGSAADWTEVRKLPVGMLTVDQKYQRLIKVSFVKDIVKNFDQDLVKQVQVSYRDGQYWVFDGQHTITAIRMKFHDQNYPVECKIYHGLTVEEEARLFYKFNNCSRRMTSSDMMKAQAFYGDEVVNDFLTHTKAQGFNIDPGKRVTGQYAIQARNKAQSIFEKFGADVYDRMLSLLKKTWDGAPWSVTQNMLSGMAALLDTFGDKIDDEKFVSQLGKVTESQIIKEAGRFCEESVAVAYASAFVTFYNKGNRRANQLKRTLLLED